VTTQPTARGARRAESRARIGHALKIDLVTKEPTGECALVIAARDCSRPLDRSELATKVDGYCAVALNGEVAQKFPECRNRPLRIQIDCAGRPSFDGLRFLRQLEHSVVERGLRFAVVYVDP
jgi:hypothetical protein